MKIPEIGIEVAELLIQAGWCKSKTEARNKIKEGGVRLADIVVKHLFARLCMIDGRYKLLDVEELEQ
jgi:tyrosyl-tRNA synthetase